MVNETAEFPKIIYILWLQGRENAPELVRINFERWAWLNSYYYGIGVIIGFAVFTARIVA